MTGLAELLARVEAAEGPDRKLDAAICAALKYLTGSAVHSWAADWQGPWEARGRQVHLLASDGRSNGNFISSTLTASLDAALALVERVLPGAERLMLHNPDHCEGRGCAYATVERGEAKGSVAIHGGTLPLALIAALLRALLTT